VLGLGFLSGVLRACRRRMCVRVSIVLFLILVISPEGVVRCGVAEVEAISVRSASDFPSSGRSRRVVYSC
jgi:hypothetical protein